MESKVIAFWPTKLSLLNNKKSPTFLPQTGEEQDETLPLGSLKNAIAVDYDFADNCVFWADIADRDIKRACLDGHSENQRLVGLNGTVEGLAYDWISQNLYWVETTTVAIQICRKVSVCRS